MNKPLLVSAALAGLILTACASNPSSSSGDSTATAQGECHGVNSCKGTGECGGPGHACAGKNTCKGQGWVKLSKMECDQKGGQFKAM